MTISLDLAARLWLAEPDEEALKRAREAGLSAGATVPELANAYTDLFVMSVYPYGTVFTDDSAELNGAGALAVAACFEAEQYRPQELSRVGAPDHAGLCLGFLAHLVERGRTDYAFLGRLLDWLPACVIAVERDPVCHVLYRELALATWGALRQLSEIGPVDVPAADAREGALRPTGEDGELRLTDIVSYLLAPARSGLFLSRSSLREIGRDCAVAVPFSSRFAAARSLFEAAGESGRVETVLDRITAEIDAWESAFRRRSDEAGQAAFLGTWITRLARSRESLAGLRETVRDFQAATVASYERDPGSQQGDT